MEYDRVAELPVTIESTALERRERETSSDFTRVTTVVSLDGEGETGEGEDVTYDAEEHDALAEAGPPDLTGEYTIDEFSARVGEADLFPAGAPGREAFRNYRRWAFESAALDLALRQADTDLASAIGRAYDPLRFVVSTRLGDPPRTDRIEELLARNGDLEFKLDPTPDWDEPIVDALRSTATVAVLDLKGQYRGTEVDVETDPALYERVIEGFPDAVIEDPSLTDETEPLFEDPDVRERVSWDAPIHGLDDVEALPWEPSWLNVKPSRFGSIESLFETITRCEERGVRMYGGGQFELDVGRGQIQALASLCYPDGPNDVAPGAYNDPAVADGLPRSPLEPPASTDGFRWP